MNWFTIGFRNIIKNKRNSLFTIMAVALGYAAINLFYGYIHNSYHGITKSVVQGAGLGHLVVFKKGFLTEGKIHHEKFLFDKGEMEAVISTIDKNTDVKLVTPRLYVTGIISNGKASTVFISQGVEPVGDSIIRGDIHSQYPINGEKLEGGEEYEVIMASGLAEILSLSLYDYAVVMSNTVDGMTNALDIKVRAILNTGIAPINDRFIIMPIKHAQKLYDTQGADRLVVLLHDISNTDDIAKQLERDIAKAGAEVDIKTWHELSDFYNQVKNTLDLIYLFISFIVVAIVVMSTINTMSMSIIGRTREIGTMRALGLKRRGVTLLFASEGAILGIIGCIFGFLIFFVVYFIILAINPTYTPPASSAPIPLLVDIVVPALLGNAIFLIMLSLLAAYFSSRGASRLKVVDALGHI